MDRLRWFFASLVPARRGSDGLTRWQRRCLARKYMRGPGRAPRPSTERTARLQKWADGQ